METIEGYQVRYTRNGRKVVVIQDIENTKTALCQEVYCAGDTEFLAGDKFVEKEPLFFEKPLTSYEVDLKKQKDEWEKQKGIYSEKIESLKKTKNVEITKISNQIEYFRKVIWKSKEKNFSESEPKAYIFNRIITTLENFILGKIKYVVEVNYGSPQIFSFEEFENPSYNSDGFRLISLFGRDDGSFSWNVNQYRDGSGISKEEIHPCLTLKEAKSIAQSIIDQKTDYGDTIISEAKKWKLKLDKDKINLYLNVKRNNYLKEIERKKKEMEEIQNNIKQLNLKLRSVK